jgi:hypothetical protein
MLRLLVMMVVVIVREELMLDTLALRNTLLYDKRGRLTLWGEGVEK